MLPSTEVFSQQQANGVGGGGTELEGRTPGPYCLGEQRVCVALPLAFHFPRHACVEKLTVSMSISVEFVTDMNKI